MRRDGSDLAGPATEVIDPPAVQAPPAQGPRNQRQLRLAARRRRIRRRRRRILIATPIVGLVLWVTVSYTTWMVRPTSLSWQVNSVEWVRHKVPFGNPVVDEIEHVYYSMTAPKKGGPQRKSLPAVGVRPAPGTAKTAAWPPPIKPVFPNPLPGEGVWQPTGPLVNGGPPMLVTTYRPDPNYPQIVAYVAWFDHTRTQLAYYPGRYEPPNAAVRGPMMVPYSQRSRLLATFNAGFTYTDGDNGSSDNGQMNEPLKDGNATLVGYTDGRVDIVDWSGGPNPGPDVAWSRQSLAPIVWNGQLNPALNDNPNSPQWGYTLGGVTRVWRTGVGIDAKGNLIFVEADGQTVISLAQILQHVGAVRAMEFDINPEWHTLITYTHDSGLVPTMVGPNPMQAPDRYLVPDDRDFFAVYLPLPGPVSVPFG
jgi:hypothetical protein